MSQALTTADVLRKALTLFGPKGEKWVTGCPWAEGLQCSATAIGRAASGSHLLRAEAANTFMRVIGKDDIAIWNDKQNSFAPIKLAFQRAIKKAERKAREVPHE